MSTHAAIITRTADGWAGIYCHSDGYPEWVGQRLHDHYQNQTKVSQLIALGDISSLGEQVEPTGPHSFRAPQDGVTVAYGRDRGEAGVEAQTGPTAEAVAHMIAHDYAYVFADGAWTVDGKSLSEELAKRKTKQV